MNPGLRSEYLRALGLTGWTRRSTQPSNGAPDGARELAPQPGLPEALRGPGLREASLEPGLPEPGARELAPQPGLPEAGLDWEPLRERVAACTRCALCQTRTQTVFGVGSRSAEWLIVGEAPGAEEDARGEPFVGRAGQLLNSMLRAIGLEREQVYIANVLKCRPPANRDPSSREASECLPYLHRQVALLKPRILLVVGRIAAQNLLQTDAPLARLRGRAHAFGAARIPLVVTYHPAYLLRTPSDKRKAWADLQFAREVCARV